MGWEWDTGDTGGFERLFFHLLKHYNELEWIYYQ